MPKPTKPSFRDFGTIINCISKDGWFNFMITKQLSQQKLIL